MSRDSARSEQRAGNSGQAADGYSEVSGSGRAGYAAPPVGTSLGALRHQPGAVRLSSSMSRTKEAGGMPIPVVVNVYNDRSFDFVTKSPPAAALLKKAAGIAKGAGRSEQGKGGHGQPRSGARHRPHEDGGLERPRPRPCRTDG